jgi:hypothetical protein
MTAISQIFEGSNIIIKNIEIINDISDKKTQIKILVKLPEMIDKCLVFGELHQIEGVTKVYDE